MNSLRTHRQLILLAFAGLVLLGFLLLRPSRKRTQPATTTELVPSPAASAPSNTLASAPLRQQVPGQPPPNTVVSAIQNALGKLRAGTDAERSRTILAELHRQLAGATSRSEAAEAILGFLRSGEDIATGLSFQVGPNHAVKEAPSLRIALIDWLGELDRVAAGQQAKEVLERMTSPDEAAVALRNYAWGNPADRSGLGDYFSRMLSRADWIAQPSGGFLESFDVIPYLGDPAFVQSVGPMLAPTSKPAIRNASLVALDRLVLANPSGVLKEVADRRELEGQPLVRATFFARADPRVAEQRAVLERYLLAPLPEAEISKFVRIFPNANRFVSYNLLTEASAPPLNDLAAMDAAALDLVRTWRSDPRFNPLKTRLEELEQRLAEHVESAARAGYLSSVGTGETKGETQPR